MNGWECPGCERLMEAGKSLTKVATDLLSAVHNSAKADELIKHWRALEEVLAAAPKEWKSRMGVRP